MAIFSNRLAAKLEQKRVVLAEIHLLRSMLAEIDGDPAPEHRIECKVRVKQFILLLLERAGAAGINTPLAIEQAALTGRHLVRSSVSGVLSRLKADGAVIYDGERYKLRP